MLELFAKHFAITDKPTSNKDFWWINDFPKTLLVLLNPKVDLQMGITYTSSLFTTGYSSTPLDRRVRFLRSAKSLAPRLQYALRRREHES